MYKLRLKLSTHPLNFFQLIRNMKQKNSFLPSIVCYYATTVDMVDNVTSLIMEKYTNKQKHNYYNIKNVTIRKFTDRSDTLKDISNMTDVEVQELILQLISKNKDKQIEELLLECREIRRFIGEVGLKKLFRHFSTAGKPEMIATLQKYCLKVDPILYRRNGDYTHYSAKAQCLKGNSDKGLSILRDCYQKHVGLRSFYRVLFRELIQDAVLNRSEASLVIFRKYVVEFSETWNEHYPLICLWHVCWSSSWFSDQMLANDLMDSSETLQSIIKEKATAFSISVLREDYNEDAVVRLLQNLLKYNLMDEYVKVLQVLFNYKLKNRDLRGCSEIIRNCEVLGVNLPSNQQGRYIKLLINDKIQPETKPSNKPPKNFKLKF